jgi:hypothetical protein
MAEDSVSGQAGAIKVLFIAGTGRSGTTILSNILGQVPGCFAGGEIRYAWQRGLVEDHRCGCGLPFSRCPLWTAVVADAFHGEPAPDPSPVAERIDQRLRVRRIPLMMARMARGKDIVKPHRDDEAISRLYGAVAHQPGVEVIVDSSKLPLYGMLLSRLQIDLTVVHMVRDPRATAFSWRRQKLTRDRDDEATMPQLDPWKSGVLWLLWNALTSVWLARSRIPGVVVRYEDLVAEPQASLERILAKIGKAMPTHVISGHTATLQPTHSVAGNPARHDAGDVVLSPDKEWQSAMPYGQRLLVTLLTLPALRTFGYPLRLPRQRRRP